MATRYDDLKEAVKRSSIAGLLERLGMRSALGEAVRWFVFAEERARRRAIYDDYRGCKAIIEALSKDIPAGDPAKPVWMIGSMHTVWGVKLEGVLSIAVRLAGMTPVAVHATRVRWIRRYHRSFGLEQALFFEKYEGRARRTIDRASSIPGYELTMNGLMELRYHDVDVGRIAVSNHVYNNKFTRLDLKDRDTRAALRAELQRIRRNVLAAEAMVEDHRPVLGLILEKGISPFAEIFGVCIAGGIPVVQYVGSQNTNQYVLKRYLFRNRLQHPFTLDDSLWSRTKSKPWSSDQAKTLMNEFADSYHRGTWFNRRYLHQDKKIKSREELISQLKLDPSKKTAVVFSHILWDATFFYGTSLFQDYETWLIETVKAACKNSSLNWVIKLHPDLVWKLKYEQHSGELRDALAIRSEIGTLPDHIKLVLPDTDINTFSFFHITDLCVTVRGTIGIEMASYGIPVLTAGTGRYSSLGFTVDSQTPEEYLDRLAKAHTIPRLSDEQCRLAQRFAHTLFMRRPWPAHSFELVKRPMSQVGDPLDTNIVMRSVGTQTLKDAPDLGQLAAWLRSDEVDFVRPE
jgi:hypothetical protein